MDSDAKAALLAKINSKPFDKAAMLARLNAQQGIVTPSNAAASEQSPIAAAEPFEYLPQQSAEEIHDNQKTANDVLRQVAKGATFDAAPRIVAGVKALTSDQTYADALKYEFDANSDYEREHPIASIALQGAGGVMVPGPALLGAATRATNAVRAAGAGRRTAQAAGMATVAAPAGVVSGAMDSRDLTDLEQTGKNAAIGGGIAAVAGPLVGAAAHKVGQLGRGVVQALDPRPQEWAARRIADEVERRGVGATPGQSWEENIRRGEQGLHQDIADSAVPGVPVPLALMSEDLNHLASSVARNRGVDRNHFADMGDRVIGDAHTIGGQKDRISDATEMLRPGAAQHNDNLVARRDQAGPTHDPFYEDIRAGVIGNNRRWVPMGGLTQLMNDFPQLRPHLDAALDQGRISNAVPGVNDNTAQRMANNQGALHPDTLRRLRTSLSQAKEGGDAFAAEAIDRVDEIVRNSNLGRQFSDGVRAHANDKARLEAFEAGSDFFGTSGASRTRKLADYDDFALNPRRNGGVAQAGARQADFELGAAGGLGAKIQADAGNFTTPRAVISSTENVRDMRRMYANGDVDGFIDRIDREGALNERTLNLIEQAMGNNFNRSELLQMGLRAYIKAKFNPGAGVADLIDKTSKGFTKSRSAEIVRQLTSGQGADTNRVLGALGARDRAIARRLALRNALSQGVVAAQRDTQDSP